MMFGIKKVKRINGQDKVLILTRAREFVHVQFVGGGGYIPRTWRTRAGAARASEKLSGETEVFPIVNGVMHYNENNTKEVR